jgi:hypothetical protein
MKPIQALVRLQFNDIKLSSSIFWSILMFTFTLMVLLAVNVPESSINQGGATALYIFSFVTGIVMINETLPFTLGMNIRRQDYYSSSVLTFAILSMVLSTIITLLSRLEAWFAESLSINLAFFSSPFMYVYSDFQTNIVVKEWISHALVMFFILCLGYLISMIFNRFGKMGIYTMSTLFLFFIMVMSAFKLWGSLLEFLSFIDSLWMLLLVLAVIAVFCSGISFVLLKKSVVRA